MILSVDPKTGRMGRTTPHSYKYDQIVEIKNVSRQGLTKQLRLQEKLSNDKGVNPILRINKDAKISRNLLESSFEISTYSSSGINSIPVYNQSNEKLSEKDKEDIKALIIQLTHKNE